MRLISSAFKSLSKNRLGLAIATIIGGITLACTIYALYTVFAYRFDANDLRLRLESSRVANTNAAKYAEAIDSSVETDADVVIRDGSQAGVEEECSKVIYNPMQGTKSLYCQQTFVRYVGVSAAEYEQSKQKLLKALMSHARREPLASPDGYYFTWQFGISGETETELKFQVHATDEPAAQQGVSNLEVQELQKKFPYVFDVYYREKYYSMTKPRNVFEYFKTPFAF